ncbi:MAG: PBP1A family penicillin-binding protein [Thermoanaerobaculia bacterium]
MVAPEGIKLKIRRGRWGKRALLAGGVLAAVLALFAVWALEPFWQLSDQFTNAPSHQPSRLYGRSAELKLGELLEERTFLRDLERLAYQLTPPGGGLAQGRFRRTDRGFEIFLRSFPTAEGEMPGGVLAIELTEGRISRLSYRDQAVASALLEAPLLATYFGPQVEERRPVALAEVSRYLIQCILASEDASFFKHPGVSPRGIVRAIWVNLRGGELRQGGSTLTQQLVKNLYLTQERSLGRKVQEGILAVFLEARYSKQQILQAYLNEIYLGSVGGVNLIGVGAASRAYFGKDPAELSLAEAAVIAGMIPAPGLYSPIAHPDRALERRSLVFERLSEVGGVDAAEIERAKKEPLTVLAVPPVRRRAPYFADAMAAEASRRFGVGNLADGGYTLFSTLSWPDQKAAEEAANWGLAQAEKGWEKNSRAEGPLQVALVSIDPATGEILAYLGGRDYTSSQFDRVSQARRQAGSSFKAVVYSAAFEAGAVTPATLVEDAPLTVTEGGQTWTPQNDDKEYAGWITVRRAVEKSLNIPTARVAMLTGLPRIVSLAKRMGVTAPLEPYPSLALGAFEVSPLELVTVYGTLATGGRRPTPYGLKAILDRNGKSLPAEPVPAPERVLSAESAFLVTSILQGVIDHGTGHGVRDQGIYDPLAGKTGTTNGRRDSWFAGYSPSRTTVVWLGYDDNARTRLSGSRAAVPIWARFTRTVRPLEGFGNFSTPSGIVTAQIDSENGGLAAFDCPSATQEYFRADQVPSSVSDCSASGGLIVPPSSSPELGNDARRPFRRWLQRIFGGDDKPKAAGGGQAR